MIEKILNYVQSFLVLFLLIKVMLFLTPRSAFEKYISFFSGVILALGVLHPILLLFNGEEMWKKTLYAATFEKQALEASINVEKMGANKEDFYNQQMKLLVEKEVKNQLEFAGIEFKEIEIELTEEYQINNIRVVVSGENEEGNMQLLRYLQEEYQLSAEQYEIVYE